MMDRNINVLDSNEEVFNEEDFEEELNKEEKEKQKIKSELKNLYLEAKNLKDKEESLKKFNEIITIEKSKLDSQNFAFKIYSYLSLKAFKEENLEEFSKYFIKIQDLLSDENKNIDRNKISQYIKTIVIQLNKFPIRKIKIKEKFLNKLISQIMLRNTNEFFTDFQNYINSNIQYFNVEQNDDDKNVPTVYLYIFYPNIPILNMKSIIIEDKVILNKKFKEINNFILTKLSNGKFIYYYDDTDDDKFIYISDKEFFNNDITIETNYKCYEIKELYNEDIMICSSKDSKIIRINYDNNTYEINQLFNLSNYSKFNYCVELNNNLISFGNDNEGYSIWKKIDEKKYDFIHGVYIEDEKRKIFPIDNMNYLTYSYFEETFENKIELKIYDLNSFNFFGRINFNANNSSYYRNSNNDKFFELNYIQNYFLLIGFNNSIWILNLKKLQILHHLELDTIKEIRILKDSSFLILYHVFHSNNKYENYYFDGKNLIKKWEDETSAQLIEVLDNFDFVFVYNNDTIPYVKISHMKYSSELEKNYYN